LEKDDGYNLEGPATVIPESWANMYVQRYANPNAATVWPDGTGYDATRKMQRNLITGDTWPADEIDDNPERYIQFGIKPNVGNVLKINNISLFLCGAGGNGMCAHVYYSTNNFATRTTIFEGKKMTANNPQFIQSQPVLSISEGQELLLRIYPWYNGTASGKTLCISDITISGIAVDATTSAINSVGNTSATTTTVFNLGGQSVISPQKGMNIVRLQNADGTVTTKKIIY
jgi:hypothetical protein